MHEIRVLIKETQRATCPLLPGEDMVTDQPSMRRRVLTGHGICEHYGLELLSLQNNET